jgi:hypothetical protein
LGDEGFGRIHHGDAEEQMEKGTEKDMRGAVERVCSGDEVQEEDGGRGGLA